VGWINQTSGEQGDHTNLVQSLVDNHIDLHDEINDAGEKTFGKFGLVGEKPGQKVIKNNK
jgi:hypothetical protein